jgi:hypothetical protein
MTVHCARCHEHKFDPISQRDYYGLQAVFAGVGRAERPFDVDATTKQRRQELTQLLRELEQQPNSHPPAAEELAVLNEAQKQWEQSLSDQAAIWTPLEVEKVSSTHNGTQFTRLDDNSYLASGDAADKDTYRLVARTQLARVSAVRLEVLPDERLPMKGPGRQENGNLHLSEVRFGWIEADELKPTWLPLQNATADFNQQGWGIERSIDGNPATAWGIFPEIAKPHQAVWEIKDAAQVGQRRLVIELDQLHGMHHLIGRFRVSVTEKPPPVRLPQLPAEIIAALAKPADERTDEEKQRLSHAHRLQFVRNQLAALPPPRHVWAIQGDFPQRRNYKPISEPYAIHVLRRGDIKQPLDPVGPGGLECVATLDAEFPVSNPTYEGERRAALAHWITAPENMLTWRSIVNRVWHYHFGRGVADSPNDLGRMGSLPTHPELLDHLALTFRDSGGSLKQLHRLLVTSATYRQTSDAAVAGQGRAKELAADSDNRFLWRMNKPRLDAEQLRDSLLLASGTLDAAMGGPSVMQFKYDDPNMEVSPRVDYAAFDPDSPASFRRGIYRFLFRNVNDPLLEAFDVSDPSLSVARRNATITSLQALSLWNNRFVLRQCEHLARRLEQEGPDTALRVDRACELLFGRVPTLEQRTTLVSYAEKHSLAALCRVLVNSNDFLFVR